MEPSKIEFDLGLNIYKQPVKLVKCRSTGGTMMWEIHRGAGSQTDDSVWIGGLTDDQLRQIGVAVKGRI